MDGIGSCSSDQFTCLDRSCVPVGEQCNKVPACPDESDERNCGMCDDEKKLSLANQYTLFPIIQKKLSDLLIF